MMIYKDDLKAILDSIEARIQDMAKNKPMYRMYDKGFINGQINMLFMLNYITEAEAKDLNTKAFEAYMKEGD